MKKKESVQLRKVWSKREEVLGEMYFYGAFLSANTTATFIFPEPIDWRE